jgi:UDP-N-acetylmuramoyl-L-alanyl-D-glutamate--2,6-diaminopimelate ligase
MERSLADLLTGGVIPGALVRGDAATRVSAIVYDSRRVAPGTLFCCLRGGTVDGHEFGPAAVAAGAAALLVDHPLELDVPQIVSADTRSAMGHLSAAFFGHPSRQLSTVGVTGTNGKTTTTHLIAAVFEAAGMPCGVIGTLTGKHTTPEAPDLQALLRGFADEGRAAVAMEVSSHALALHRVDGCRFAAAVFTNLGRDHLDLHHTIDEYFAAKAALFTRELSDIAVVNVDDPYGRLIAERCAIPTTPFGLADISDLVVAPTAHEYTWRGQRVRVGLGGAFNVMNSLAAATTVAALGVAPAAIAAGLAAAPPVPGRFEAVTAGQPFDVIVDYAHTPDGLQAVLTAARDAAPGRVLVVFGCGGDRDAEKRPQMGAVAAELADAVVITSDNPRSEDPLDIINAVFAGVPAHYRARVVIEPERRRAFSLAFQNAGAGDVVVIAGKGHETTQTIGCDVLPFDDRQVARELLGVAS